MCIFSIKERSKNLIIRTKYVTHVLARMTEFSKQTFVMRPC